MQAEDSLRDVIVAQECHIVGASAGGPRGASSLSEKERNAYPNLVLMCLEHHKMIDDDPETWTVEKLLEVKADHEQRVEEMLSAADRTRAQQELTYARFASEWASEAKIDEWRTWTSHLLAPTPTIEDASFRGLSSIAQWLFTRPWPGLYMNLEQAFENFRQVASDLAMVIAYGLESDGQVRRLIPLYHKQYVDNYDELADAFNWTVDLIHDLVFELTRAANLVCDVIRYVLDPLFRLDEGILVVERQDQGLYSLVYRPRYTIEEAQLQPYPGLERFLDTRTEREVSFGEGRNDRGWIAVRPRRVGPK